ncbi:MAG: hypothetical protein GEU80_03160 [Dehalococcoidia bacterium]|nr:hypothetical protein [Dehalococcoidia bacterium]
MPARAPILLLLLALTLLAGACEGDVPAPVTPIGDLPTEGPPGATTIPLPGLTPTPEPPSTATPTPEPTPTRPPDEGRRSGDPGVDAVIEAIVTEDLDALVPLALMRPRPCTPAGGTGGAPDCPPDVIAGAEVEAFPVGACDLSWRRDVADTMRRLVEDATGGPYAVLASPEDDLEWVTYGDHMVVFRTEPASELVPPIGLGVFVEQGRVVHLNYLCSGPAEDFLTWRGINLDVVLPPPALEGTRTGIPARSSRRPRAATRRRCSGWWSPSNGRARIPRSWRASAGRPVVTRGCRRRRWCACSRSGSATAPT